MRFIILLVLLIWGGSAFLEAAVSYSSEDKLAYYLQWTVLLVSGLFMGKAIYIRYRERPSQNFRSKARTSVLISVWIAVIAVIIGTFSKLPGLTMTIAAFANVILGSSAASAVNSSYYGRKPFYKWAGISTFVITSALTWSMMV